MGGNTSIASPTIVGGDINSHNSMTTNNTTNINNGISRKQMIILSTVSFVAVASGIALLHHHQKKERKEAEQRLLQDREEHRVEELKKQNDEELKLQHDAEMKQAESRKKRAQIQEALEKFKLDGELIGRNELLLEMVMWTVSGSSSSSHSSLTSAPSSSSSSCPSSLNGIRVWYTSGAAGTGKSAISTGLSRFMGTNNSATDPAVKLLHHHICQLRDTVRGFVNSLLSSCVDMELIHAASLVTIKNIGSLFLHLASEPINDGHVYCILIDGMDECHAIRDLFTADILSQIPSNIRLFITSRPDPSWFLQESKTLCHHHSLDDSKQQRDAVRAFISTKLSPLLAVTVAESKIAGHCQVLAAKCGPSFIYARLVLNDIKQSGISNVNLNELPSTLNDYYHRSFIRSWPTPTAYRPAKLLLSTIGLFVSIEQKILLSCQTIDGALSVDEAQAALDQLAPFISRTHTSSFYGDGISPYHKSLMDWLTSVENGRFRIDYEHARRKYLISMLLIDSGVYNSLPPLLTQCFSLILGSSSFDVSALRSYCIRPGTSTSRAPWHLVCLLGDDNKGLPHDLRVHCLQTLEQLHDEKNIDWIELSRMACDAHDRPESFFGTFADWMWIMPERFINQVQMRDQNDKP